LPISPKRAIIGPLAARRSIMRAQRIFIASIFALTSAFAAGIAAAEDSVCFPARPDMPCQVDGGSYFVRTPAEPKDWSLRRRMPMVVLLHDKGDSAAALINDPALVEGIVRRGFALVVPVGLTRSFAEGDQSGWYLRNTNRVDARVLSRWEAQKRSDGLSRGDFDALLKRDAEVVTIGRDEIAFLRSAIAMAATQFHLETPAAVIIGIGHGAALAWEAACAAPDLAELFAPVNGSLVDGFPPDCNKAARVLHTQSTSATWPAEGAARVDLFGVPPDTDRSGRPILARRGSAYEKVDLMPVSGILDAFASAHGCSAAPETVAETGGTLSTWNGCAAPGTALAYWRQDGAFAVSAAWLDRVLGEQIAVAAEGEAPAAPHFLKPRPPTRAVPDQKPPSGPKFVRPKSILP
jgi:dienelactone hydrolase